MEVEAVSEYVISDAEKIRRAENMARWDRRREAKRARKRLVAIAITTVVCFAGVALLVRAGSTWLDDRATERRVNQKLDAVLN